MRIGTLFSGIGSPEQAAKRVYNDFELVFACEWDKFARQSFKANYKIDNKHFHKDIADMDGTQYKNKVDIIIGGSPCQDFSLAGLRKGIKGNKGILIYEYIRIIQEIEPPIFIYENVKGMLYDRQGKTIKEFLQAFRDMGYFCHYKVLNTKDYGVPQNRERIFIVGFKDDEHYHRFEFAPKIKLEKRLKDILESDVDEKYYLTKPFELYNQKSQCNKLINIERECNTLISGTHGYAQGYIKIPQPTKKGFTVAGPGDSINLGFVNSPTSRGKVNKNIAGTLDTSCNQAVIEPNCTPIGLLNIKGNDSIRRINPTNGLSPTLTTMQGGNQEPKIEENYRIRKLTPRECFRLQDFPDSFKFVVSNSQLYKQAGNSISVNVMEMIFNQIEKSRNKSSNNNLFDFL